MGPSSVICGHEISQASLSAFFHHLQLRGSLKRDSHTASQGCDHRPGSRAALESKLMALGPQAPWGGDKDSLGLAVTLLEDVGPCLASQLSHRRGILGSRGSAEMNLWLNSGPTSAGPLMPCPAGIHWKGLSIPILPSLPSVPGKL